MDLGFNGNLFTWCNKRSGEANIWEQLDRVIVSTDWRLHFDRARVLHLNSGNSDHSPILLCGVIDHPSRQKPFRFIDAWTRDPSCGTIVQEAWSKIDNRGGRTTVVFRIRNTTRALQHWNKHSFGYCQSQIKDMENQLKDVQGLNPFEANIEN